MKSFAAVSVVPASQCCDAAKEIKGVRLLATEAPRLPLPGCTMPAQCKCRFQKFSDRRTGDDRRLLPTLQRGAWYSGSENRKRPKGRRATD